MSKEQRTSFKYHRNIQNICIKDYFNTYPIRGFPFPSNPDLDQLLSWRTCLASDIFISITYFVFTCFVNLKVSANQTASYTVRSA